MPDINDDSPAVFSRPFPIARVSPVAFDMRLEAGPDERKALAAFLDVVSVDSLSAELKITAWRREGARVRGHVSAHVTQACVVTLEPIESDIKEEIDATFLPEHSRHFNRRTNEDGEYVIDPDGPDEPEAFSGSDIDIGALVTEAVALAIDPFARKPGAELPPVADEDDGAPVEEENRSPFAALKDWKGGSEK